MAARPATAPDMMPVALMRPVAARSDSAHASAPAEAAKCVLRMAVAALSVAPSAQPPEMPAQPGQAETSDPTPAEPAVKPDPGCLALVRGGRYDEVGAVFGRNRPAVGFSLDVKALVGAVAPRPLHAAIRAPWGESAELRRLREHGNTVVVIEHNLDVIKTADYIIDMGPEGGDRGGTVIAKGTPEEIVKVKKSYTGYYVKKMLEKDKKLR